MYFGNHPVLPVFSPLKQWFDRQFVLEIDWRKIVNKCNDRFK